MTVCEAGQLHPPADEKAITTDEQSVRPLKARERRVDLLAGASFERRDLHPHGAASGGHFSQRGFGIRIVRIDQTAQAVATGHKSRQGWRRFAVNSGGRKFVPVAVASGRATPATEAKP